MAKVICVAGAYHGHKAEETLESDGRLTLDGTRGTVEYVLRRRQTPVLALYVPAVATEAEIQQGFEDLWATL